MGMQLDSIEPVSKELVLAIDPGVTTGFALFQFPHLRGHAQFRSTLVPSAARRVRLVIDKYQPQHIVVEEYVIYPWMVRQQSWSSLHTVRLIGAIELIAADLKLPLTKQQALKAKNIKDKSLKQWNLYKPGKPHANDAIRHAVAYTLFGPSRIKRPARRKRRNNARPSR